MGGSYLGSGVHYERIDDAVVFRAGEASKQVEIRVNGMENVTKRIGAAVSGCLEVLRNFCSWKIRTLSWFWRLSVRVLKSENEVLQS